MLRPVCAVLMVAVVVGIAAHAHAQEPSASKSSASVKYDDFMRLSVPQRREQFSGASADSKALLVRTHAERWMAANKARLSASELAALREAMAFITPRIYEAPSDPQVLKLDSEVRARTRCRVNTADVAAAFSVFDPTPRPQEKSRWTYLNQAKCWIGWFAESVVDYLPALPR